MRFALIVLITGLLILGGCASSQGPETLMVSASEYQQAFDAATQAVREEGFIPSLRDRRTGIIETDSRPASTALEPWHADKASFSQAMENTIAYQRRRVRLQFVPAGTSPVAPASGSDEQPPTPEVPKQADPAAIDLTQMTADQMLELRAWVYIERASTPGLRRSSWSRRTTSTARLVVPEGDTGTAPSSYWTPVSRDQAFERRLLASIEEALQQ